MRGSRAVLVVVSGSGGGDAGDGDRAWRMRRRGDQSGVHEGRRSTLRAFTSMGHNAVARVERRNLARDAT